MSKSLQDYFQNELQLLNESMQYFAKSYPHEAAKLHLDTLQERDPHIERLLEGCAYLTARVKQQIDIGVNHVGESVLRQLAPDYLTPQPSMTIVQFTSPHHRLTRSEKLPAGVKLVSNPVGEEETSCEFQTIAAIDIHPVQLYDVELCDHRLKLSFKINDGVSLSELNIDCITLYIHDQDSLACEWYYYLTTQVRCVSLSSASGKMIDLGGQHVIKEGREESKSGALLFENHPHPFHSLRRYFHFPEGGRFVTLNLRQQAFYDPFFTVEIECFTPIALRLQPDLFKLHCVPAINLFLTSGEPIQYRNEHSEYPIVLSQERVMSKQLYAIKNAIAISKHNASRIVLQDLYRAGSIEPEGNYYRLLQMNERQDVIQSKFVFSGTLKNIQCVSYEAWAYNGHYPNHYLHVNDLYVNDKRVSLQLQASNITRPCQYQRSTLNYQLVPSILATLNADLERFKSVSFLKRMLLLHDGRNIASPIINSIMSIDFYPFNRFKSGLLQKGITCTLLMGSEQGVRLGEVVLLGKQLYDFLQYFKPMNLSLEIKIELKPSGQIFLWGPNG
ncbi:type VI secretion system baseplate subunit TssF [Legionella yabuuchiae]|uniref:type VI secretion system baseplate subunit TssF n=1 Tax=Legionella yabuuchiae TaxID=376727 RepID=UPI0013EF926F|nr:type VI secretion system baseplate subunit TssF [Legionella yabuuchiae]